LKRPRKLSATFVKTVSRPGRYGDGRGGYGLSLLVKPSRSGRVSKSWSQRVRLNGQPTYLGLGPFPLVTLAEARSAALENARAIRKGIDPRSGGIPSFARASEQVIRLHEPNWKNGARSAEIWRSSLRRYVFPRIGRKRVDKVTAADLMSCLLPIWNEKRETARRLKQRIGAVLKWSIAQGYRDDNPTEVLAQALPRDGAIKKHQRAVHHSKVADAIAVVHGSKAFVSTRLALEFLVLTAARSGEVRGARWREIDLDAAVWTVPAQRMKAKKPHRVPLSGRAIEILRKAAEVQGERGLVFPSVRGKVMSDNTLSKILRERGVDSTVHGMRSSFRDWCAETGQRREDAEAALAHIVGGVEGSYFRSDLFERRRKLMAEWADYLAGQGI